MSFKILNQVGEIDGCSSGGKTTASIATVSPTPPTVPTETSTDPEKCQREAGDELLTDVSLLSIVVAGKPTLNRTYPGYKITCSRCYSILGGLLNLLNIRIGIGGYHCNKVLLEVNINLSGLLGRCQVYGRRLKAGESAGCT
ncbi:hypothetical protein TSAR_001053 [Trichomalopsis sarcophagae]|uniref:Uncharacterized protein n=1 Tax=Trichomalopsis sarcophagae TaxID=543379 RepID=A0A232FH92_9HYME|nr:hypothetical protein TSAR_001053 [Trichomalopsis sarcophagae]